MKDKQLIFIDSNILVYNVYGTEEQKKLINRIITHEDNTPILSTQVLKEFTNVSIRKKLHKTSVELKKHLTKAKQSFIISDITLETIIEAIDLRERYKYSFYDSLIIATALESKCTVIYSEDLQHKQIIKKKLEIRNPFITSI